MKVLWKDGSESWVPLKTLKETFPIEAAEFAVANEISDGADIFHSCVHLNADLVDAVEHAALDPLWYRPNLSSLHIHLKEIQGDTSGCSQTFDSGSIWLLHWP